MPDQIKLINTSSTYPFFETSITPSIALVALNYLFTGYSIAKEQDRRTSVYGSVHLGKTNSLNKAVSYVTCKGLADRDDNGRPSARQPADLSPPSTSHPQP